MAGLRGIRWFIARGLSFEQSPGEVSLQIDPLPGAQLTEEAETSDDADTVGLIPCYSTRGKHISINESSMIAVI